MDKEITYSQIAKIAFNSGCVLLGRAEWDSFTKKLWNVQQENERLKKINDRLRKTIKDLK